MSTIAAGTTSGTALVNSGDTTGQLILQTNGTTTAVTIGTNQVVTLAQPLPVGSGGTGSTAAATAGGVGYGTGTAQAFTAAGTSGQALVSNGASAPTFGTLGVSGGGTGATTLTSNNVILGNGTSAVQFVAPGTNGNVLTSNGTTWASSAAPTPTAAQGASMVLLASVTASASAFLTFDGFFTSTYDTYVFIGNSLTSSSASGDLFRATFRYSGSYASGITNTYAQMYNNTSAATPTGQVSTASSDLRLSAVSISCFNLDFVLYVNNPLGSGYKNHLVQSGWRVSSAGGLYNMTQNLSDNTTSAPDGIRFYYSLGNTASGTIRMYGIKKS
jgi:hypothetical protein